MIGTAMQLVTVTDRADLVASASEEMSDTIPEYNNHGETLNRYWGRLTSERPDFQFHLLDDDGHLLARARTIPVRWDGTVDDLPNGIDGAITRGFEQDGANALCALIVNVPSRLQGRGLSAKALQAMREIACRHDLQSLIAPVRPNWKERYPLVPIERYAQWRRPDGLLFDPWMRVHERLGATILKPEPRSLRISGAVTDWEQWTGTLFPESGEYWFPHGLATVTIDRGADQGLYWEPNVWMRHPI